MNGLSVPLAADEVHVWRIALDPGGIDPAMGMDLLDAGERERAARFRFDRHRRRFVLRRAALRRILARYAGQPAAALAFEVNAWGKPALRTPGGCAAPVAFSLSHSHERALLAVGGAGALGIDIEWRDPDNATVEVARQFFAPAEVAELERLDPARRVAGFFDCWTRKEAYIKAHGMGLSIPLDAFAVTLTPGAPPRIVAAHDPADDPARWRMRSLDACEGYAAALMTPATVARITMLDFDWNAAETDARE
jgi:4'-phosphopantetheinyl transferase